MKNVFSPRDLPNSKEIRFFEMENIRVRKWTLGSFCVGGQVFFSINSFMR